MDSSIPKLVLEHGLNQAHPAPLVGSRFPNGRFHSWRTDPIKAWEYFYLELANAGSAFVALVLDCDKPEKDGMLRITDLPLYSWAVRNLKNNHAHVAFILKTAVHKYPKASRNPLRFLKHIAEYYREAANADSGYTGTLTRNPVPPAGSGTVTQWGRKEPYSLNELATVIPVGWRPPKQSTTGIGRNCNLYQDGMAWAGRKSNRDIEVYNALVVRNQKFIKPLPLSDVQATANSIERYRAGWSANGWHDPDWIARQAARGSKPKKGTINKSAMPEIGTNEKLKPWEAEGISRITWYRKRKKTKKR